MGVLAVLEKTLPLLNHHNTGRALTIFLFAYKHTQM